VRRDAGKLTCLLKSKLRVNHHSFSCKLDTFFIGVRVFFIFRKGTEKLPSDSSSVSLLFVCSNLRHLSGAFKILNAHSLCQSRKRGSAGKSWFAAPIAHGWLSYGSGRLLYEPEKFKILHAPFAGFGNHKAAKPILKLIS
jgi:hypothetical protein